MQLQRAELENLFYAWLVRRVYRTSKFAWMLVRAKPATRWFFVKALHAYTLQFLGRLFKGGVITDPKKKRWILERERRIRHYIDTKCEAARNLSKNQ